MSIECPVNSSAKIKPVSSLSPWPLFRDKSIEF